MSRKKLTTDEIENLKSLKQRYDGLIFNLGQIELDRIKLNLMRKQMETEYDNLTKFEEKIATALNEKYGKGYIDPNTQEFIDEADAGQHVNG